MLQGNVLLVSKNQFMRQGLVQALAKDTLSVVGEELSAVAALALLQSERQHVDVIVLDAESAGTFADLKAITDQFPQTFMVILTAGQSPFSRQEAGELNLKALLPYSVSAEALNITLQLVMLGEDLFLSSGEVALEVRSADPSPMREAGTSFRLSDRETEILRFIQTGAPNKIIARELDVAEATVKVHVKSVLRKIDAKNRTQAAVWALQNLAVPESRAA